MAYPPQPPQPQPQGPWGPQAQGGPQGPSQQEYSQPGYGRPPGYAPPPGHAAPPPPPPGHAAPPPPPPGQGPQPPPGQGQGGPPAGYAQPPAPPSGQQPPYGQQAPQGGQAPYGQQAPHGGQVPHDQQPPYGQPPHQQNPYNPQQYQQNPYNPHLYQQDSYTRQHPYDPGQLPPVQYGPPPKTGNGLIIGLSVGLGALLLAGGTIGAIVYLNSSSPDPTSTVALQTESPTASPTGSDAPSSSASAAPSDPPTSEPAQPSTSPTDTPPSTSKRAVPNSPITDDEFDDWNFGLGDVKFSANKVAGWTYDTCDPVDSEGVLAKYDCVRAVQLAYSAYGGHVKAVQLMMAFPNEKAAKSTATRLAKLTSDAVNWRKDKAHRSYAYGKIRSSASKKYVIVTIVTADQSAKSKAEKFHAYLQTDHASYFLLRDLTITS